MTAQTSKAAYRASKNLIQSQLHQMLQVFKSKPNQIYCDYDLSILTGLPMNIVWSRRNTLQNQKKIVFAGTILNEDTGRQVHAYKFSNQSMYSKNVVLVTKKLQRTRRTKQ